MLRSADLFIETVRRTEFMVFLLVNAEHNRWNPPPKIVPTYKLNIGAKQSIFNLRNRGGNMVDFKHQANNQV